MMRRLLPLMLLVVVTNVVMLGSVLTNRNGEPDATLVLTERELHLERNSDRDSAQKLQLATQAGRSYPTDASLEKWLTPDKLATLGIVCRAPTDHVPLRRCGLGRRAFAVYEYDGPAWQAYASELLRAPVSQSVPEMGRNHARYGSRLVALDAALDRAALRRAYPDGRRYLILPVDVSAWVTITPQAAAPVVSSAMQPVTTTLIVPAPLRDRLSTLAPSDWLLSKEPRYTVTVAVGRHLEPWILAIEPIDTGAVPH
jgi:Domain of unknown function (DUF4824)